VCINSRCFVTAARLPGYAYKMDGNIPVSELGPILTTAGFQSVGPKYAAIACFAVFMYDYLLTLNDEIKYIWRRHFSLVTFAYFFNRYYAMFSLTLSAVANLSVAIDGSVMFSCISHFYVHTLML